MDIGHRIKERRKQLHMSAEQLAAKIGKSPATMYRYEKGVGWDNCREGSNPSFSAKTLENIEFLRVFHFLAQIRLMAQNGRKLHFTNNITNNIRAYTKGRKYPTPRFGE